MGGLDRSANDTPKCCMAIMLLTDPTVSTAVIR